MSLTTEPQIEDPTSPGRAPSHDAHPRPRLLIRPASRWPSLGLADLRDYRGLLGFLVWRDIKVRYAQTVLGVGWAILQPLLTMLIFTVIFGRLAGVSSDGRPYAVFALAALVPWTYFSTAVTGAGNSLVLSTNLLTKVYFPRLLIPLAPVLAGLLDLAFGSILLAVTLVAFGIAPSPVAIVALPVLVVVMALTAAGVGCWLAALNIQYRDVKYAAPFLIQIWMYMSPIVYPMSIVPERYRPIYALNPMAGIIEGFRRALLGTTEIAWSTIGISLLVGVLIFGAGTLYFRMTEKVFADVA